jgi:hypothetical protein
MTTVANSDATAAKQHELAAARTALEANFNRFAGTSKLRGKLHKIRGDAQLRRSAELGQTVRRLERELESLRNPPRPTPPLDLSRLPHAQYVRTKYGWYEVVKVNAKSVKVLTAPGMDDRIPVGRIVEIREHEGTR